MSYKPSCVDSPLALACLDDVWMGLEPACTGAEISRLLDQIVERGFNAVRVDPCPHLLMAGSEATLNSPRGRPITLPILSRFEQLLSGARQRGLKLWLTSRFYDDHAARRSFVRRPEDFADAWLSTLAIADRWKGLDAIAGIDFCYHFPAMPYAHGIVRRVFGRSPERGLPRHWNEVQQHAVQSYFQQVPALIKAHYPTLPVGVSGSPEWWPYIRDMDLSALDFLSLSVWLDEDPHYRLLTGVNLPVPKPLSRIGKSVGRWMLAMTEEHWENRLETHLLQQLAFSRVRGLEPVVGEGYFAASEFHMSLSKSLGDMQELLVVRAINDGVRVMTPSSMARPCTPGLWQEIDYLRHLNAMIKDA